MKQPMKPHSNFHFAILIYDISVHALKRIMQLSQIECGLVFVQLPLNYLELHV